MTPGKSGPPTQRRARRFCRISSLTERMERSGMPWGERLSSPRVFGSDVMLVSYRQSREQGTGKRGTGRTSKAGAGNGKQERERGKGTDIGNGTRENDGVVPFAVCDRIAMSGPIRDFRDLVCWQRAV